MHARSLAFVVAGIGVFGCGHTAGPVEPPAFPANAAAPQWQQFCQRANDWNDMNVILAKRGAEGWELVGLNGHIACFKRQATPAADGAAKVAAAGR
jgi:hypothetical protein